MVLELGKMVTPRRGGKGPEGSHKKLGLGSATFLGLGTGYADWLAVKFQVSVHL
jgi:hypothetical protein